MTQLRSTARLRYTILIVSAAVGVAAILLIALAGSGGKTSAHQVTISHINQIPWPRPAASVPTQRQAAAAAPAHVTRPRRTTTAPAPASLARMIGQEVMVRMTGTSPDATLLDRIRRGEVGGVILYADNIVSDVQIRALTSELQA